MSLANAEVLHENTWPIEMDPEARLPTVTFDRAIAHFAPVERLDFQSITDFYDQLPHENKPPLDGLNIHVTAAAEFSHATTDGDLEDTTVRSGIHLGYGAEGSSELKLLPDLPETRNPTIIIYMGTPLKVARRTGLEITSDELNSKLNEALTHELTHFAQLGQEDLEKRPDPLTKMQKFKKRAIYLGLLGIYGLTTDKAWAKRGMQAGFASEVMSFGDVSTSIKLGLAAAALTHVKQRKDWHPFKQHDLEAKHQAYLDDPQEEDARAHEDGSRSLVTVGALRPKAGRHLESISIVKENGRLPNRRGIKKIRKHHRWLATTSIPSSD